MSSSKLLNFNKKIILIISILGSFSRAFASGIVSVAIPHPVVSNSELSLEAEVLSKFAESNGRGSYRLSLSLPTGVLPAVGVGSFVKVFVPTIHQSTVSAQVISMTKNRANLILSNQVQQLEGQRLKVEFPVQALNLFKIPFQSIVSPRGLKSEVFILTSDMKVSAVEVTPIQILNDGYVIVSSEDLKNKSIIIQGTDNLMSGDSVQVNKDVGALL